MELCLSAHDCIVYIIMSTRSLAHTNTHTPWEYYKLHVFLTPDQCSRQDLKGKSDDDCGVKGDTQLLPSTVTQLVMHCQMSPGCYSSAVQCMSRENAIQWRYMNRDACFLNSNAPNVALPVCERRRPTIACCPPSVSREETLAESSQAPCSHQKAPVCPAGPASSSSMRLC